MAALGSSHVRARGSGSQRIGAEADATRVRALAAYNDLLSLWKDLDPNIIMLEEAKSEYWKVQ